MQNNKGFTIYELTIVIAIILILSSIGMPSFLSWRNKAKLDDATSTLQVDLEMAKLSAMQENEYVAILFSTNNYLIFIDNGSGSGGIADNWIRDGEEKIIRNRQLPTGVSLDLSNTTFSSNRTRFNGRGQIGNQGKVTIANNAGKQKIIDMNNRFGRTTVN